MHAEVIEYVCYGLPFPSIVQLAIASSTMQHIASAHRSVPVLYADNVRTERPLLKITRWETLKDVEIIVRRFSGSWMADVMRCVDRPGWKWTPSCKVHVHQGTRWRQTGVGLQLRAIGLLRMYGERNGSLQLTDGSTVPVEMRKPLRHWVEYNARNGQSQGDSVDASCTWSEGVLSVSDIEDLPSTLCSDSSSDSGLDVA